MGRSLLEFRSEDEHDKAIQLASELGHGFWVGGNDFEEEGVWVWNRNGEEIETDQLWAPNEPNGGAQENCLEIYQGGINDLACEDVRRYVCVLY